MIKTTLTIPQKQSNSGSIYDLASDCYTRVISFGTSFEYAVVLPSYYGHSASRHKTAESAFSKLKELSDYSGVRVFNRSGQECYFGDFEFAGKVQILCEHDDNGFEFDEAEETRTEKINRLQKRYPGTRRQRNSHGAGEFSVDFFSKSSGELVASYEV